MVNITIVNPIDSDVTIVRLTFVLHSFCLWDEGLLTSSWAKKCKPLCRPCGKAFKDWPTYNKYLQGKHGQQTEWTCNICNNVQTTLSGYQNHMLMHNEDKKKKICEKGQSCFSYQSQLDHHMITHLDAKAI